MKPGNILFDEDGVAKLTYFSLSKIVLDDVGSQAIELTSQGASVHFPGLYRDLSLTSFMVHKVNFPEHAWLPIQE